MVATIQASHAIHPSNILLNAPPPVETNGNTVDNTAPDQNTFPSKQGLSFFPRAIRQATGDEQYQGEEGHTNSQTGSLAPPGLTCETSEANVFAIGLQFHRSIGRSLKTRRVASPVAMMISRRHHMLGKPAVKCARQPVLTIRSFKICFVPAESDTQPRCRSTPQVNASSAELEALPRADSALDDTNPKADQACEEHQKQIKEPPSGIALFICRLRAAWEVFFPPKPEVVTAKDECKRRLRMTLHADRCGISSASFSEMKTAVLGVLSEYVEVRSEDEVSWGLLDDATQGTVYTVSVPVKRLKSKAHALLEEAEDGANQGIQIEWSPEDWDEDPASRFPYGC